MAFHAQNFCGLTGLQFDKKSNTCWGKLNGFPVFVTNLARKDSVVFRLIAKLPAALPESAFTEALNEWSKSHTGVAALSYQNRCLACIISLTPRDTDNELAAKTAELAAFAGQQGMTGCCMSCGAESGYHSYLLDNGGITLCEPCRPYLETKMHDEQAEKAQIHPNWGGLILGALLGAAAVFGLTFFVLKLRFLSLLTGFAGILLGLYLMRKLGKKITPAAAVICAVLCLAASLSASVVHFAGEMADYNMENYTKAAEICMSYENLQETIGGMSNDELAALEEMTGESLDLAKFQQNYENAQMIRDNTLLLECLHNFKALIGNDLFSSLRPELLKCVLFSLLSIIAGVAVTAPGMIREDQGKHSLRELPQ